MADLRSVLGDLDDILEKSAGASKGPTVSPTQDDSRDLEKKASTDALGEELQANLSSLLTKMAGEDSDESSSSEEEASSKSDDSSKETSSEDKTEETSSEESSSDSDDKSTSSDEGADTSEASTEKKASAPTFSQNQEIPEEDIVMLNKLASSGTLQKYTDEQLLDAELSKQAGYQLALETTANIIAQVGGTIEKSASVAGYHEAIDQTIEAGHMSISGEDLGLLKQAADTQIAQSYLDTLVSQGSLTAEGQALILNSLAQVPEINEQTIASAVAGLDPQQAAAAQQALMDQFIQKNTTPVPAGAPMIPATMPGPSAAEGMVSDPSLAPKPSVPAPMGMPADTEKKAAAWDRFAPDLISEAQAFEKLASENPELWAMVQGVEKQASEVDPVAQYYANYLQANGYGVE